MCVRSTWKTPSCIERDPLALLSKKVSERQNALRLSAKPMKKRRWSGISDGKLVLGKKRSRGLGGRR